MPYTVKEKRRADSLMRGARVVRYATDEAAETPLYVLAASRKLKYTYLDLGSSPDGPTVVVGAKFANDEKLDVLVKKLTAVEQLDNDVRRAQRWVTEQLAEHLGRVPADVLIAYGQAWHDGPYKGHVLDWSDAATFFKIQARYRMWQTIAATFTRLHELYGTEVTQLSAFVLELNNRDEERRNRGVPDPLSRSTSVFSNLIDDLDRYVWDELIDNARYYVFDEVREHEMMRLRELAAARQDAVSSQVDVLAG